MELEENLQQLKNLYDKKLIDSPTRKRKVSELMGWVDGQNLDSNQDFDSIKTTFQNHRERNKAERQLCFPKKKAMQIERGRADSSSLATATYTICVYFINFRLNLIQKPKRGRNFLYLLPKLFPRFPLLTLGASDLCNFRDG